MAGPSFVRVLGSGHDGTSPCALLELDARAVLLNATEGLQRLESEHHLKLHRRLDAVVLSSLRPWATAGLPGLLITLAKRGRPRLDIFGPPGAPAAPPA